MNMVVRGDGENKKYHRQHFKERRRSFYLYACFLFIEIKFYGHISLPIQLLAIALLIVFTYFVASPLWMKSFPRKRNFAIRLMLGIILVLSYAWDFLRTQHSAHVFSVEIFIVPIILVLLFFSLKESIIVLLSCVVISAINVLSRLSAIHIDAVFRGCWRWGSARCSSSS
ncbi:hypothetical protein HMSSN036_17910 [Paenibacillus macerans]|nr:hypothetical protein HMSSN036_17910 [Paenibacillus macerans]